MYRRKCNSRLLEILWKLSSRVIMRGSRVIGLISNRLKVSRLPSIRITALVCLLKIPNYSFRVKTTMCYIPKDPSYSTSLSAKPKPLFFTPNQSQVLTQPAPNHSKWWACPISHMRSKLLTQELLSSVYQVINLWLDGCRWTHRRKRVWVIWIMILEL